MTYDRGYHFGFSDATGDNTVELFGRLQVDTGGYTNYNPGPETLDRKGLSDGVDLRRARIGVIGTFMSDWHYAFVYDFGNSSDSSNINNALASANSSTSPTTSNSFLSGVENAFITYNGFYSHGQQFPVAFDFGIMDVPWTLEEATSSNDLMFLERSSAQVIATTFGGGDFRSAIDVRSNNDRYWLGAYLTGPQCRRAAYRRRLLQHRHGCGHAGNALRHQRADDRRWAATRVPGPWRLSGDCGKGRDVPHRLQLRQSVRSEHRGQSPSGFVVRPAGASHRSDLVPGDRQYSGKRRAGVRRRSRRLLQELLRPGRILSLHHRYARGACRRRRAICKAALPVPRSISTADICRRATASAVSGITIRRAAPIPA